MFKFIIIAMNILILVGTIFCQPLFSQIRSDFVMADGKNPIIEFDKSGNMHAAWWKNGSVYYGLFDSLGNKLTDPKVVSKTLGNESPRLGVGESHIEIVWTQSTSYIAGQLIRITGDSINSIVYFNEYTWARIGLPDIAFLNDSTFIVVWLFGYSPPPPPGIYGRIAGTSLHFMSPELLLSDHPDTERGGPRVLSHYSKGGFIVVWKDNHSGSDRIYGRCFNSDGTPKDSSFLISEDPQINPIFLSAAIDTSGRFIVVWSVEIDDKWIIQRRQFKGDGIPIGSSERISTDSLNVSRISLVDVAFDIDGKSVVVWEQEENGLDRIYGQRFLADGTTLGDNFRISSQPDTNRHFLGCVALRNGKIYTTWDGSVWGPIWANIIDFHNPPVGMVDKNIHFPIKFRLFQNHPNPFNPNTIIEYEIYQQSEVILDIYNVRGERVITLINRKKMIPGNYQVQWNGINSEGRVMSSGIYFYRLKVGRLDKVKKMVLVR